VGGVDVAYYLVHAMAGGAGFEERERVAAGNFARMAKRGGVGRVVYLGGLGQKTESKHLRSRHETARILAAEGPPLTYFGRRWWLAPAASRTAPCVTWSNDCR
jgi:uncharacterized protein YbjT (DUF2867 family)